MKLKPCPFCNSNALDSDNTGESYYVRCLDCASNGPKISIEEIIEIGAINPENAAKNKAEKCWNKR
jgi:hypothetical protein